MVSKFKSSETEMGQSDLKGVTVYGRTYYMLQQPPEALAILLV
jgi:hypothetical protein